jgi:acetyl-CoA acetyltransferase
MLQFEDLGFCAKDDGAGFIRRHDFAPGGDLPHNTGGGQLSCGQAGAAGGFLGLVEALRQLAGDARHALVSGFGMINYDRGLCTAAAVLAR